MRRTTLVRRLKAVDTLHPILCLAPLIVAVVAFARAVELGWLP